MVPEQSSVMSETADIALTTVLTILIITDISSNLLVIFVIKKNKDMRYVKLVICYVSSLGWIFSTFESITLALVRSFNVSFWVLIFT